MNELDSTHDTCGHEFIAQGCGTGYTYLDKPRRWQGFILATGAKVCYKCADAMQREDMRHETLVYAYIDGQGKNIITWTGGYLAVITHFHTRKHWTPTGGEYEVAYIDAKDQTGGLWHGRGPGLGMYVRLKRSVKTPAVTHECWELASRDASLGVGHVWTRVECPAYRTLDPKDCDCQ